MSQRRRPSPVRELASRRSVAHPRNEHSPFPPLSHRSAHEQCYGTDRPILGTAQTSITTKIPPEPKSMLDPVRQEVITSAKTVVVKIGTSVLTRDDGTLDRRRLRALCRDMLAVLEKDKKLVVVSSGAVGAGVGVLGLPGRPNDLAQLQAAAAVGQSYLIRAYDEAFRASGFHAAQLLLTASDFSNRTRYLNIRNTLRALFSCNAIPVINENDTVSVEELKFGDNDRLAALVTTMLPAAVLIILSVVDGLLRPSSDEDGELAGEVIPIVPRIDAGIYRLVRPGRSRFGTGGMASKLQAAKVCSSAGECVILANGRRRGIIQKILAGERVGTLFLPEGGMLSARKRWLAFSARAQGAIVIDEGAERALRDQGRSLLAVGVLAVQGNFSPGSPVRILNQRGVELGRGLVNYSADELRKIKGLRTTKIREMLGAAAYDEVIHRDNLVLSPID